MRKFLLALLALFVAVGMALPTLAQDSETGYLRFAHFSPAVPSVVVFLNGEIRYSGLNFQSVTRWDEVEPGTYEIAVGDSSAIEDAVITGSVEVTAGGYVTAVAVGSNAPLLSVINESFDDIPEGNARVTIFHGIEGAPPVDVLANGSPIVTLLAYPGTVVNPDGLNDGIATLDVPAGTYDLGVALNGTSTPIIDLSGTTLEAGLSYLVAAVGTADAPDAVVTVTDPASFVAAPTEEVGETEEAEVTEEAEATEEMTATEEMEVTEEAEATEEMEPTEEVEATEEVATEEPVEEEPEVEETAAPATLVDLALGNPELSTLVAAVQAADPSLLETVMGTGNFTIFAPTNDAFEATLADMDLTLDDLVEDPDALTAILQYHIVRGTINANLLRDGANLPTLSGDTIAVSVDGDTITLNDSVTITEADLIATNGVIHLIDGVLLPEE